MSIVESVLKIPDSELNLRGKALRLSETVALRCVAVCRDSTRWKTSSRSRRLRRNSILSLQKSNLMAPYLNRSDRSAVLHTCLAIAESMTYATVGLFDSLTTAPVLRE